MSNEDTQTEEEWWVEFDYGKGWQHLAPHTTEESARERLAFVRRFFPDDPHRILYIRTTTTTEIIEESPCPAATR